MKRNEIKRRPMADTTLNNLEPEPSEYRELDSANLYFRVKPNGNKSWLYRYKKPNGKWSWLGLGSLSAVGGVLARKHAATLNEAISKGENPIVTKQLKKQAELEASNNTLEKLANEFFDSKANKWTMDTMKRNRGSIEKHIIPVFGKRPYTSIKSLEWMQLFKKIQKEQGIIEQVNRMCSLCRDMYDLAKVTGRIEYNPLEGVGKFLDKAKSENMPHVPTKEFPMLLRSIRNYPTRSVSLALQLLAMLFPRPSELSDAAKTEFQLKNKLWIIPAERMKRRIEFAIPLPDQAVVLLEELFLLSSDSPYLLPSRSKQNQPISNNTLNMALKRMGYEDRQTPHGFRHIASSHWNKQFSDRSQVVESALSHLKQGVKGVYDKEAHLEERAPMQQWWADYLDTVASDQAFK